MKSGLPEGCRPTQRICTLSFQVGAKESTALDTWVNANSGTATIAAHNATSHANLKRGINLDSVNTFAYRRSLEIFEFISR